MMPPPRSLAGFPITPKWPASHPDRRLSVKLLRAATLTVADPEGSARRYVEWFGYRLVERGRIDAGLAASWAAPRVAGRRPR